VNGAVGKGLNRRGRGRKSLRTVMQITKDVNVKRRTQRRERSEGLGGNGCVH
jgi:hypothetical protein